MGDVTPIRPSVSVEGGRSPPDLATGLRQMADAMDAGEYGVPRIVSVALMNDEGEVGRFCMVTRSSTAEIVGLHYLTAMAFAREVLDE